MRRESGGGWGQPFRFSVDGHGPWLLLVRLWPVGEKTKQVTSCCIKLVSILFMTQVYVLQYHVGTQNSRKGQYCRLSSVSYHIIKSCTVKYRIRQSASNYYCTVVKKGDRGVPCLNDKHVWRLGQ